MRRLKFVSFELMPLSLSNISTIFSLRQEMNLEKIPVLRANVGEINYGPIWKHMVMMLQLSAFDNKIWISTDEKLTCKGIKPLPESNMSFECHILSRYRSNWFLNKSVFQSISLKIPFTLSWVRPSDYRNYSVVFLELSTYFHNSCNILRF